MILPIDHPSNRLGDIVFSHEDYGEIRQSGPDFYYWPIGAGRAFYTISFDSACEFLGVPKPVGWADYAQTKKLGRMIERTKAGEIWKSDTLGRSVYYVWLEAGGGCVVEHFLSRARAWIEIKERA